MGRRRSYSEDHLDAFRSWIRGQSNNFEEIAPTAGTQFFRFKVKSSRRRTGIVDRRGEKFVLSGAAPFHFDRFLRTLGRVKRGATLST